MILSRTRSDTLLRYKWFHKGFCMFYKINRLTTCMFWFKFFKINDFIKVSTMYIKVSFEIKDFCLLIINNVRYLVLIFLYLFIIFKVLLKLFYFRGVKNLKYKSTFWFQILKYHKPCFLEGERGRGGGVYLNPCYQLPYHSPSSKIWRMGNGLIMPTKICWHYSQFVSYFQLILLTLFF